MADGWDGFYESEKQEMKRWKRYIDRVEYVGDGDFGFPTRCPCGVRMVEEFTNEPSEGKRYVTCNAFEGDGLHWRKPWERAIQEEVSRLSGVIEEQTKLIQTQGIQEIQITRMRKELENNAQEIARLKGRIEKLFGPQP